MNHIPNVLTLFNLLAGFVGIVMVPYDILFASTMIYVAMMFDFLDGFVARLLKTSSEIGKELDSLADVVSFGVLPALILFHFMVPDLYWSSFHEIPFYTGVVLLIPICAAVRLARFNIDTTQQYEYKGLPVPANATWIASIPFVIRYYPEHTFLHNIFSSHVLLMMMVIVFSLLMVSKIPLLAIKFRDYQLWPNVFRYAFLIIIPVLLIFFRIAAVPYLFVLYLISSAFHFFIIRRRAE